MNIREAVPLEVTDRQTSPPAVGRPAPEGAALQSRRHDRRLDRFRAAAAERLERQVRDGRRWRFRRQRAEPGAGRPLRRARRRSSAATPPSARTPAILRCDHRRELGARRRAGARELRASRRAPHGRSLEGHRRRLLQARRRSLVLLRLLARRRAGHGRGATLSRRFRRHHRGSARARLGRRDGSFRPRSAGDLSESERSDVAGHHGRQPQAARHGAEEHLRRAGRRGRRHHRRPAELQVRPGVVAALHGGACGRVRHGHAAGGDQDRVQRAYDRRRAGVSGVSVRRRERSGRLGSLDHADESARARAQRAEPALRVRHAVREELRVRRRQLELRRLRLRRLARAHGGSRHAAECDGRGSEQVRGGTAVA